jgi:hypothetical protein
MRPALRSTPRSTALHLWSAALIATASFACSDEDPELRVGPCRSSEACGDGASCVSGVCYDDCTTADDCPSGVPCLEGVCRTDRDASDAGGRDTSPPADASDPADVVDDAEDAEDADSDPSDAAPDARLDAETDADLDIDWGPLRWEFDPPTNATRVPLDVSILVEFNQPMRAARFIPSNIQLQSFGGETVARSIEYDASTFTLQLDPQPADALLRPATPYTLRLAPFIGSESGFDLERPVFTSFATEDYEGSLYRQQLARAYGPVIYQQVRQAHIDTFTSFDFDGDENPANNFNPALPRRPNPAHVYYAVVETPTHFFITYMLYYPGTEVRDATYAAHDTLGVQVIVARTTDPLGRLVAWSVMHRERLTRFALENSFYPEDAAITGSVTARLPATDIEAQRRVPLFVQDLDHAPCLPTRSIGRCAPNTGAGGPFVSGRSGYVYRPGDLAEIPGDNADDNLTYRLIPFTDDLWVRRNRTDGPDAIFGGLITYSPPLEGETERPGAGARFPTAFNGGTVTRTFGELPFLWAFQEDPPGTAGHWFVDPIYYAPTMFTFPVPFSREYCLNPWINIDDRTSLEGCSDPAFALEE